MRLKKRPPTPVKKYWTTRDLENIVRELNIHVSSNTSPEDHLHRGLITSPFSIRSDGAEEKAVLFFNLVVWDTTDGNCWVLTPAEVRLHILDETQVLFEALGRMRISPDDVDELSKKDCPF